MQSDNATEPKADPHRRQVVAKHLLVRATGVDDVGVVLASARDRTDLGSVLGCDADDGAFDAPRTGIFPEIQKFVRPSGDYVDGPLRPATAAREAADAGELPGAVRTGLREHPVRPHRADVVGRRARSLRIF